MNKTPFKCIVAANNISGFAHLLPIKILCGDDDVREGLHYDAARQHFEDKGYDVAMVIDEADESRIKRMFSAAEWEATEELELVQYCGGDTNDE